MNIANKLKAIKRANKKRNALPFHSRKIHGVNVHKEQLDEALLFIKTIFKKLKAANFKIDINLWGEIILTEPIRGIQLYLSVRDSITSLNTRAIKEQLKNQSYFEVHEIYEETGVEVAFKANRQGAKWRATKIPDTDKFDEVSKTFVEQMALSIEKLVDNGRLADYQSILEISSQDILCVMQYGAALYGAHSQFAYLLQSKDIGPWPDLKYSDDKLTVYYELNQTREITLNTQSKQLLKRYLGC